MLKGTESLAAIFTHWIDVELLFELQLIDT